LKMRNKLSNQKMRRLRAILNIVMIVLLIPVFYISIGSPAFSAKHQFRREEKARLIGPAKILDTISLEQYTGYYPNDSLLIAASDKGVTLFTYNQDDPRINRLVYRNKQGDISAFSVPGIVESQLENFTYAKIPVIVFDSFPEAVRAEMEIELHLPENYGSVYHQEYKLTAKREAKGYFLFTISAGNGGRLGKTGQALWLLTYLSDDSSTAYAEEEIPVTVRFYDEADNLIAERTAVIRSTAGEAHS